jgi:ankyrin repeat protein
MAHLAEQFACAVADGQLESSLAMLAGCPGLASIPCRKALYSSLHWSCASVKLAPLTRALLALGCPVDGFASTSGRSDSDSPLRWAASCGNRESLDALLSYGARPVLTDLLEACRRARGACALAMLSAAPDLDPNESPAGSESCKSALVRASQELSPISSELAEGIQQALSYFEKLALEAQTQEGRSSSSGSKRL